MGQAKVLQGTLTLWIGQVAPPCWAGVITERDLVFEPVAQDLVQAVYSDQPETLQSMGQAKVLQVAVAWGVLQATPPFSADVITERSLDLRPEPQDLSQAPYLDQPESLQSMGQANLAQARNSALCLQSMPPLAAAKRMERVRCWLPVPHEAEQAVQVDHMEILQSMAQAKVLQVVVWALVPQATPP